jgi:hypothetical protein
MTGHTDYGSSSTNLDNLNPCFLTSIIRELSARNAERNSQQPFPIIGGKVVYPEKK